MTDMLVKLYALPLMDQGLSGLGARGVRIRRSMVYESPEVVRWVSQTFNDLWAAECDAAFGRHPVGCHIAVKDRAVVGFCCVDCTFRNFVGPIGVSRDLQGLGVGCSLLLAALSDLKHAGYAYAVIGDVGEPAFFEKAIGAVQIADSTPGPYPPRLK